MKKFHQPVSPRSRRGAHARPKERAGRAAWWRAACALVLGLFLLSSSGATSARLLAEETFASASIETGQLKLEPATQDAIHYWLVTNRVPHSNVEFIDGSSGPDRILPDGATPCQQGWKARLQPIDPSVSQMAGCFVIPRDDVKNLHVLNGDYLLVGTDDYVEAAGKNMAFHVASSIDEVPQQPEGVSVRPRKNLIRPANASATTPWTEAQRDSVFSTDTATKWRVRVVGLYEINSGWTAGNLGKNITIPTIHTYVYQEERR